jgi:hypothetical protein
MFAIRLIGKLLVAGSFLPFLSLVVPSPATAYEVEQVNPHLMIVPAPVQVPAGKSLADVKDAIYKAINGRGWTGKEVAPNVIEATYDQKDNGKRILVVDLKYDTRQVEMQYKHSKSLKYQVVNGERLLHRRGSGWMKNLASDINRFLER